MEERILNKLSEMKNELKQEIGKVSERVDKLAVGLEKTNEKVDKLAVGLEKTNEKVDKLAIKLEESDVRLSALEQNQDKMLKRMDRIDQNQLEFNGILFETNNKLDKLIEQNRNMHSNQTAILAMQTKIFKDQKELRENLLDGGYFVS